MKRRKLLTSRIWPIALFLSNFQMTAQIVETNKPKSAMKQVKYENPLQIPVEDFFRNPEKSSFKVSPDGSQVAYLAPSNDRLNIFVQPIEGGEARKVTDITDRDIDEFEWANDGTIIYLKDIGGDENFILYFIDLKSGKSAPITPEGSRAEIIDMLDNNDDAFLYSSNQNNAVLFDLYRFDLKKMKSELVAENPGNITSWVIDHEGVVRLGTATDGTTTTLMKFDQQIKWVPLIVTNFKENLTPLFFDFNNKNVYCSSNLGRDKSAIVLFDLESAKESEVIFEHPEVDVTALSYSPMRKVLTTIVYETEKLKREILDDRTKNIFQSLKTKLPKGMEFNISNMDKSETHWIVRTYSDVSQGAYYHYQTETGKLFLLENVAPWLDENLMSAMTPITYTSRNGVGIHGYLTLPKSGNTNLPVIINPHGGPWARDSWGFNAEVQFLASRGYAVLQMNFTGSTGYGRKFWEQSFKQWGQLMQDDISDGVQYLLDRRIADRTRVAIYGGSYGGYATLAGLAFTPEFYACGVDYVGVSNLFTFQESIPPYWKPYREMMYEMIGDPSMDSEMMKQYSPVFHAEYISAPLMIAQGAKDPRVNIEESNQMVQALESRGVKVKYLVEPEEGHGFHNQENKFKFYNAMAFFLSEHLNTPMKYDADAEKK